MARSAMPWLGAIFRGRRLQGPTVTIVTSAAVEAEAPGKARTCTWSVSLEYDWAFNSEEFKEYCGLQFQDTFRVSITDDADVHDLQTTTVDGVCAEVVPSAITLDRSKAPCTPTPDVGVGTGGNDCKVWTTGWKHQSVSLASLLASNAGKGVTLTFSATDVGDSSYDTAILLDNIEIKTAP